MKSDNSDEEDSHLIPYGTPLYNKESKVSFYQSQKSFNSQLSISESDGSNKKESIIFLNEQTDVNKMNKSKNFFPKDSENDLYSNSSNRREGVSVIENLEKNKLFNLMLNLTNKDNNMITLKENESNIDLEFIEIKNCVVGIEIISILSESIKILKIRECKLNNSFCIKFSKKKFNYLTKLDFSMNSISAISNFDCPNLVTLNLAKNTIVKIDINNFENLTYLENLDLSNNLLSFSLIEFKDFIQNIKISLSYLKRLNLKGNPLCSEIDIYKEIILLELYETLEYLDDEEVNKEEFKKKYNFIRKEIIAKEMHFDKNLNLSEIKLPYSFHVLINLIEKCFQMPNQLLNYLNKIKALIDFFVKKSAESSVIFKYQLKNNKNSLEKEINDFLGKVMTLMEQDQHANSFMFDILAKMTLLKQENIDIPILVFNQLISLMKRSEQFKDCIVVSIKNECLHSFCPESIESIEFSKLSRLNKIIAMTNSLKELVDKDFSIKMENWLTQILKKDLKMDFELYEYLHLADFFCLNICINCPNLKFADLMKDIFVSYCKKQNRGETSQPDIINLFLFWLKVLKNWLFIEKSRDYASIQNNCEVIWNIDNQTMFGKNNAIFTNIKGSNSKNKSHEFDNNKYFFEKKFFLIEETFYQNFILQIFYYYKDIINKLNKSYENNQQKPILEIFNCLLSILAELLTFTSYITLDADPYTSQGQNLFQMIFSGVDDKVKNNEFKTIILNFAFKIFNNR